MENNQNKKIKVELDDYDVPSPDNQIDINLSMDVEINSQLESTKTAEILSNELLDILDEKEPIDEIEKLLDGIDSVDDRKLLIGKALIAMNIEELFDSIVSIDSVNEIKFKIRKILIVKKIKKLFNGIDHEVTLEAINSVRNKRTMIQRALITKNIPAVKLLLEMGADIMNFPEGGNSTFHLAIYDYNILLKILEIVKSMEIPQQCGKVIYYSIFEKKFDCLGLLLKPESPFLKFKNISIMNVTPLHVAFGEGHFAAVKQLIDVGVDKYIPVQADRIYPIHVAAAKGNYESFLYLIRSVAHDIEEKSNAIAKIDDQILEFNRICIENGINDDLLEDIRLLEEKKKSFSSEIPTDMESFLMKSTANTKMTPYHFASFRGSWKVLDDMLKISTKCLNLQTSNGMTPILYATSEGQHSCVAVLLSRKPNIFLEDKNCNNAIVYSSFKNRYYCGILLMDHINKYADEFTREPYNRDILLDKKIFLVLSICDTTKVDVVTVTEITPETQSINMLTEDINNIYLQLQKNSTSLEYRSVKWHKYRLLHIKYEYMDGKFSKGNGITRDYLNKSLRIFLKSGLFYSKDDGLTYSICYNENYESQLENMKTVGIILALSCLNGSVYIPLDNYIFKTLTGETIYFEDFMPKYFIDFFNTIESNSSEDIMNMDIDNFVTVPTPDGNKTIYLSSKKDFLTHDNIKEYKERLINLYRYGGGVYESIKALKQGFNLLIPSEFLTIPDNSDLIVANLYSRFLITAADLKEFVSDIPPDVENWKQHTAYINCNTSTKEVKWFWEFVENSDKKTKGLVLKFATGSPILPLGGFKYLRSEKTPFVLSLSNNSEEERLPSSQTCVNTINLSVTSCQEVFNRKLLTAIEDCDDFSFV